MRDRCIYIFLGIILFGSTLSAQQSVTGKIYSSVNDSVIVGASVQNKKSNRVNGTDNSGKFSIAATEGDSLIFSATGFEPDTVVVQFHMLLVPMDITLDLRVISLENVEVRSDYSADSLARRNFYKDIYTQKGITGGNRPADGVGISISPISYFSKAAKQKRELKKRLIRQEREEFIDYSFPEGWVSSLTGLKGDSLKLFMTRYRPTYEFCRTASRADMIIYVSDKFKEFRKAKTVRR